MDEEERTRVPFPCHRQHTVSPMAGATVGDWHCPICHSCYRVDFVSRTMIPLVPDELLQKDRKLLALLHEILRRGDDVLVRRTKDGKLRIHGQRGYTLDYVDE